MPLQLHRFIASSAADAIAQVRQTLGADAVVVDVRRPGMTGLARLWQRPRIEVLATIPEKQPAPAQKDAFAELRRELRELRRKVEPASVQPMSERPATSMSVPTPSLRSDGGWRIQSLLEQTGLLPRYAHRVLEELRQAHGEVAPQAIAQEIEWACEALRNHWTQAPRTRGAVHVLVGPPGSGKTTCLSKWLAQTVLVEERQATVFRLDAHVANTAESLTVLGEILGIQVERFAPAGDWNPGNQTVFIDLPGVNPSDADALASLEQQLARLPSAEVHLVLNAAYDTQLLLGHARGFSNLPISDVIATHLDEEGRSGRLWNLVMGGGYPLCFLSAGQNIPGEFIPASPDLILGRQFPQHRVGIASPAGGNPHGKSSAQVNLT